MVDLVETPFFLPSPDLTRECQIYKDWKVQWVAWISVDSFSFFFFSEHSILGLAVGQSGLDDFNLQPCPCLIIN